MREKFIFFIKRLFDFLLLGNIVFWVVFGIAEVIFKFKGNDVISIIVLNIIVVLGGLSTLGIVFRRKELSQKQGLLEFWKSSFLYITGYFKNAPQEQEGIEPPPRKKLKIKRFIIAGSVLLLLVIGVVLIMRVYNPHAIIQYREENPESNEVQSRKSGGLTQDIYEKLRQAGQTDYMIIQQLRQREDVAKKYNEWLGRKMSASDMIQEVLRMDAARRVPISNVKNIWDEVEASLQASNVKLSPLDVELFDMRLDGTGGYKALSGRVKNKSVMEVKEIKLSITLYDLTGKPIDSGTATISCSIPPFAVRSVTGDVTKMTPSEPLREPVHDYFAEEEKRIKDGWEYTRLGSGLGKVAWQKRSWTWNYQILSIIGRKGQLGSK